MKAKLLKTTKSKKFLLFFIMGFVINPFSWASGVDTIRGTINAVSGESNDWIFGLAKTLDNFMIKFAEIMNGLSSIENNKNAKTIFYGFLILFCIFNTFHFVYKMNIEGDGNKSVAELLNMLIKGLTCAFVMMLIPKLTTVLIKLMWNIAEFVLGQEVGKTMSYSLPLTGLNIWQVAGGTAVGGGLTLTSIIHPGVMGTTIFSGTGLGSLSSLAFAIGFAGVVAIITSCVLYMTTAIHLYLSSFSLMLYLPSTVFDGFNWKVINAIKHFWTLLLELFLGAVIIMLVLSLDTSQIKASLLISIFINSFLKPVLLTILLPLSNKIISSLAQGSGGADASHAVQGGVAGAVRGLSAGFQGAGKGMGGMSKGISDALSNRKVKKQENDERNELMRTFEKNLGEAFTADKRNIVRGMNMDTVRRLNNQERMRQTAEMTKGWQREADALEHKTADDFIYNGS